MLEKLKSLREYSYSLNSGYKVACIIEMQDGTLFEGVNVENPSFKDGLCAEQVAIGTAIANGYKKGDFKTMHLYGMGKIITPCFLCRQVILEFFKESDKVISYDEEGNTKEFTISELCPNKFDEGDLI